MDKEDVDFADQEWKDSQTKEAEKKNLELHEYIAKQIDESVSFVYELENEQLGAFELGDETGEDYGGPQNKGNLLDKARDTPVDDAISELFDNIFQNHLQNVLSGHKGDLNVDFVIPDLRNSQNDEEKMKKQMIRIQENSGGISSKSIHPFVQMGESDWDSVQETSVGTWGSGSKVGMACLGRWNTVFTNHQSHPKQDGLVSFELGSSDDPEEDGGGNSESPKNYYHRKNTNWIVKGRECPPQLYVKPGETVIFIRRITDWARDFLTDTDKYQVAIDRLKMIFHCKIETIRESGSNVEINMINNSIDTEYKKIDLAELDPDSIYSGDFDKYKKKFALPLIWDNRDYHIVLRKEISAGNFHPELHMKILIGHAKYDKSRTGIVMWGNNRLFAKWVDAKQITALDGKVLSGYTKFSDDSKSASWICFVKFESEDPRVIPWSGPIKWGYHKANQVYSDDIEVIIARIATSYMAQSGVLSNGGGFTIVNDLLTPEITHTISQIETQSED